VNGSLHRRFWVLLVSAAAAYGAWRFGPGTSVDHTAFVSVARGFANPPLFVTGQGSVESPWKLRVFSSLSKLERKQAPVIVSIGDDTEGVFQESPPAPIDMALVFTNFKRLGKTKAASAAILAWEAPDPIGLAALEKSLDAFESLVLASPLSRGAVSSAMPPAFRRASIPLAAIQGDVTALSVVNRLSISGAVLGGEKTLAGFSVLESEPWAEAYPLVARWEDRAVFAFPLLSVLQRLNLPIDGVEIRLGEYLKLGKAGPLVRIDKYGRIALPLEIIPGQAVIPAEALIDGGHDLFPGKIPDPVILRDDQSAAEAVTREFSRNLATLVAAIAGGEGLGQTDEYPRMDRKWEMGVITLFVLVLTFISGVSWRHLGFILLAGVCLVAQWFAFGCASLWLPGLPVLAAIGAAFAMTILIGSKIPDPVIMFPMPQMEMIIPPEPLEPPAVDKMVSAKLSTKATVKSVAKTPAKAPAKPPTKKAAKKAVPKKSVTPKSSRPHKKRPT
jgi:hypothetical protein